MKWAYAILVTLVALASLSCGSQPTAKEPSVYAAPLVDEEIHAGVARADITPPPHLSLFGHGPESRIATGFRMRLRCQAFVFATRKDVVALVPCDLASPSLALHQAVVERLLDLGIPISNDKLMLMATHTHAGPAHYFEARRYSGSFSSSAPGYDEKVKVFLADRIASAVSAAYSKLKPACLSWGRQTVEHLTFNRSYAAFMANQQPAPGAAPTTASPRNTAQLTSQKNEQRAVKGEARVASTAEGAVDPTLHALRIDERTGDTCSNGKLMGVFAIFGMHNTGVPNTNELYHGDVFGFATRATESCLLNRREDMCDADPPDDAAPVVGIANGIEGDVSPNVAYQSFAEARRLGRLLKERIIKAVDSASALPGARTELTHATWDLRFPGGIANERGERLCPTAALGMSAAGGARDGPTRIRIIPEANPGYRLKRSAGCQGAKLPLVGPQTSEEFDFPRVGPISLVRVGGGIVATAPGELTTTTGLRIREAIRTAAAADESTPIPVVGLTNSYLQYFATEREYDLQLYEGASTLYGPLSSSFLVRHFGMLAQLLNGSAVDGTNGQPSVNSHERYEFDPSPVVSRLAVDEDDYRPRQLRKSQIFGWHDVEGTPTLEMEFESLPLALMSDRSRFSVQVIQGGKVIDDDRGANIEVRELDGGDVWRVRWVPALGPEGVDRRCNKGVRLAVRGRISIDTDEVKVQCLPPSR